MQSLALLNARLHFGVAEVPSGSSTSRQIELSNQGVESPACTLLSAHKSGQQTRHHTMTVICQLEKRGLRDLRYTLYQATK